MTNPISFMSSYGTATNLSYPNIAYSSVLPTMYTNYAGDLQVTNIDPYGGYNLGLMFNNVAQQTWGIPNMSASNYTNYPTDVSSVAAQQAESLLAPIYNNMASSNINQATQAIQSSIAKLESKLAAEDTKEEEKAQIQDTINKLKEQAEKLDQLKKSTELDPETAFQQSKQILNDVNQIFKDAEAQAKAAEEANAENAENAEDAGDAEDADSNASQGVNENVDKYSFAIEDDAADFYEAISGWGTDEDTLTNIINTNVSQGTMDKVMLCWNRDQAQNDGESLIEAYMADVDHEQAKKEVPLILKSLVLKAQQLGIDEEKINKCRKAVRGEIAHGAFHGMDDDVVCENIDELLGYIAEAQGSKYGSKDC